MDNPKTELTSPSERPYASPAGDAVPIDTCVSVSKKLPRVNVGMSDYKKVTSRSLYIDKTLIVKDILDDSDSGVFLFMRPRRFGKTFMMTTLKAYFEKPGSASDVPATEDTSQLFQNRKIWACGEQYHEEQGKYPVIYLTFKDCKSSAWKNMYIKMESDRCDINDLIFIRSLIDKELSKDKAETSLAVLSRALFMHYGVPAVILIDEYDTPLQQSHFYGYYDKVKEFYGNLLSAGFQGNSHMKFAVLTGILQVPTGDLFRGLGNLRMFSVLDSEYREYFGFTEGEIRQITRIFDRENKYSEICEFYEGYCFGGKRIFNPWDLLNCIRDDFETGPYWLDTSDNDLVQLLTEADHDIMIS